MRFFEFACYDIREGLLRGWKKYLLIVLMLSVFCMDYRIRVNGLLESPPPEADSAMIAGISATVMDYLIYIFRGMEVYIPSPDNPFRFPVIFLMIHLPIGYFTLHYPYHDLSDFGQHQLVRARGRSAWWFSKCLWVFCCVLVYYAIVWAVIFLFCGASGVPFDLNMTPMLNFYLSQFSMNTPVSNLQLLMIMVAMPVLVSLAITLLQLTLSLFIKPLFSFGITAILLLASAYFLSPVLPGNYAMLLRYHFSIEDGLRAGTGVVGLLFLIALSVAAGGVRFKRYDILGKE